MQTRNIILPFLYQLKQNFLYLGFAFTLISFPLAAQEKKVANTSTELFNSIQQADSALFDAYNKQDLNRLKTYFSKDLEWFQDNGGLLHYKTVIKNFDEMFHREYKLHRNLVRGSLEVHPIKNYGAIEIGSHQFQHIENGKEEIGTFKFLMLWQFKNGNWKITRVFSFDH